MSSGPKFCKKCGDIITSPSGQCKVCGDTAIVGKAGTFLEEGETAVHTRITDRYVSSAHDVDMNDGLRRMADVRPEWVDKECASCKKTCTDGALEGPSGFFKGKPMCQECFSRTFSKGECAQCHAHVIEGEYVEYVDGRIWHKDCFPEEHRCETCKQPIFGEITNAIGKEYHPKCFQCGKCQKHLDGSYVNYHGAPYCKPCADESKANVQKTQVSNPNDPSVKLREANNAKAVERQGELADLQKFEHVAIGDICAKCSQEILENALTIGSYLFHEDCFVCSKCSKPFADGKFSKSGNNLYHSACVKAAGDKCPKCDKAISGKFLDYNGQKVHAECFKCGGCKKSLAGEAFGEDKGSVYCIDCMKHHATRSGPSGVHTGAYTPGFTVNPVTGAKEQRGAGGAKIGAPVTGLGTKDACPKCKQAVYVTDSVPGPNITKYHRRCLACSDCGKWLDSNANVRPDGAMYCRDCVRKH